MTDPTVYTHFEEDATDASSPQPAAMGVFQKVLAQLKAFWSSVVTWFYTLDKQALKEQWQPSWPILNVSETLAKILLDGILLVLWWTGLGLVGLGWWWLTRVIASGWLALQTPVLHEPAQQFMPALYKDGVADEACYQYRGALLLLLTRGVLLGAGLLALAQLVWVFAAKASWDGPCLVGLSAVVLLVPCVALVQQLVGVESYQRRLVLSGRIVEVLLLLALGMLLGGISLTLVAWVSVLSLVAQLLAGLALVGVVHMEAHRLKAVWQQHWDYSKGRKIAALNEWLRQGGFIVAAACWIGPGTTGVLGVAQTLAKDLAQGLRRLYPWEFPHKAAGVLGQGLSPFTNWQTEWFSVVRWATTVASSAVVVLLPLTLLLQWMLPTQVGLGQTLWLWLVGLQLGQVAIRGLRWVLLSQPEAQASNQHETVVEVLGQWPAAASIVSFWATAVLLIPATALGNSYGLLWMLAVGLGLEAALLLMAYGLQITET